MIDHDVIERYVDQMLEVVGIPKGTEGQLRLLLSHLYTAVSMYQLMDADGKERVSGFMKILNYNFGAKLVLKERKRNKEKETPPLHPSIKEKENKEKEQKNPPTAVRREMFHQECLGYADKFNIQLLSDFYNYWSEEDTQTNKMRFEKQRFWNTERRIKRWMNISYASTDTAAALRLERTKQNLSKEDAKAKSKEADTAKQQQTAIERDDANEKLFRQLEENKKKAVSYKEYLKKKNENAE